MADATAGSWHNSGYFGHYRSRVRNDFKNEYRQNSKPSPPRKFLLRTQQPATRHLFSHHDNRESFLTDALYFSEGLGRRRVHSSFLSYQPDFIAWLPHKAELDRAPPSVSSYRLNFSEKTNPYQQMYSQAIRSTAPTTVTDRPLAPRPPSTQPTKAKEHLTTIYRITHNGDALDGGQLLTELNRAATQAARCNRRPAQQQLRAATARQDRRESVASCLSWHRPETAAIDYREATVASDRAEAQTVNAATRAPKSTCLVPPVASGTATTSIAERSERAPIVV